MLVIDIDNLKMINDLRGHSTGDAVVARTAEAIRKSVRPGHECGRLGDEFLVYAPDSDGDGAMQIANTILRRLAKQGMPLAGAPFSVSIGIAVHEEGAADYARMHREADSALYQARAEGRNRIATFDAETAVPPHAGTPPRVLI